MRHPTARKPRAWKRPTCWCLRWKRPSRREASILSQCRWTTRKTRNGRSPGRAVKNYMLLITRRRIIGAILMSPTYSLLFAFSLSIIPALHAEKIDNRDFAIDTCFPTPNEIRLAEGRTRAYWAKHGPRFGAEPRFLAVETSKVFPGEVQDLWPKLINSETTASFFSHGIKDNSYSNLYLLGVMIFDTRTGRFVSNQGYISVDTPPRGSVARFGPYLARYIGWG
jgi:hypothetical protein